MLIIVLKATIDLKKKKPIVFNSQLPAAGIVHGKKYLRTVQYGWVLSTQ